MAQFSFGQAPAPEDWRGLDSLYALAGKNLLPDALPHDEVALLATVTLSSPWGEEHPAPNARLIATSLETLVAMGVLVPAHTQHQAVLNRGFCHCLSGEILPANEHGQTRHFLSRSSVKGVLGELGAVGAGLALWLNTGVAKNDNKKTNTQTSDNHGRRPENYLFDRQANRALALIEAGAASLGEQGVLDKRETGFRAPALIAALNQLALLDLCFAGLRRPSVRTLYAYAQTVIAERGYSSHTGRPKAAISSEGAALLVKCYQEGDRLEQLRASGRDGASSANRQAA